MANFVTSELMGTTLELTDRYARLEARGVGSSGVIWFAQATLAVPAIH